MDIRGNLESSGSEEVPKIETPCVPTITLDGNDEALSGIATGIQETKVE